MLLSMTTQNILSYSCPMLVILFMSHAAFIDVKFKIRLPEVVSLTEVESNALNLYLTPSSFSLPHPVVASICSFKYIEVK